MSLHEIDTLLKPVTGLPFRKISAGVAVVAAVLLLVATVLTFTPAPILLPEPPALRDCDWRDPSPACRAAGPPELRAGHALEPGGYRSLARVQKATQWHVERLQAYRDQEGARRQQAWTDLAWRTCWGLGLSGTLLAVLLRAFRREPVRVVLNQHAVEVEGVRVLIEDIERMRGRRLWVRGTRGGRALWPSGMDDGELLSALSAAVRTARTRESRPEEEARMRQLRAQDD